MYYGTYAAFPPTISGVVTDIEEIVQTDSNRDRMRHLAHLPKQGILDTSMIS